MSVDTNTIPSRYASRLVEQAVAAGCEPESLLTEVGLSLADLEQSDTISALKYGELYQLVMRKTHDEWFGMFSAGKVPLGAFRIMCLTLLQCTTLRQVIIRAGEFAEICRGMNTRYFLEEDDSEASITLRPVNHIEPEAFQKSVDEAKPEHLLTAVLTWHRFAEWLVSSDLPIKHVVVTYSDANTEEPLVYTEVKSIKFNQPYNGIIYDAACLDLPVVQNEENLLNFLRTAPYHLVTEDPSHIRFSDKVRNILKKDVSASMPSSDEVASQLHMSTTTLRRKLQNDNTSYQRLKDECRMEAAFHLLNCADLSNTEIAQKLGFDEPSAFFRSFKKWTGQTPGEYRAR